MFYDWCTNQVVQKAAQQDLTLYEEELGGNVQVSSDDGQNILPQAQGDGEADTDVDQEVDIQFPGTEAQPHNAAAFDKVIVNAVDDLYVFGMTRKDASQRTR